MYNVIYLVMFRITNIGITTIFATYRPFGNLKYDISILELLQVFMLRRTKDEFDKTFLLGLTKKLIDLY